MDFHHGEKVTTPFKFQLEDIQTIEKWGGRGLVAWEPGLGKSFGSLLYAIRNPSARPIVIVCPANIKWVWEQQVLIHTGWRAEILEGTKVPADRYLTAPQVTIINYDILYAWWGRLQTWKIKLAIIDECQWIKDRRARRTKAVQGLCVNVPYVLALSGTPLLNRPVELFPTLNLLRPWKFPSWGSFAWRYGNPKRTPWGIKFEGASNLQELNEKLKSVMVRRKKEDVIQDLPPKRRIIVPLDVVHRDRYDQAVGDFRGWFAKGMLERSNRVEQITKLTHLKQLVAKLKLHSVYSWVDDFLVESEGKIVLGCIHRSIVKKLHERYDRESVFITGAVTGKMRQLAYEKFLKDPQTRILVCNIQAAGVGWSGKGVGTVAFVEYPWSPGELIQLEDRIHGMDRGVSGQRSEIYFLTARHTIEESIVHKLQRKQEVLSKTLDGKGRRDDLNIWDLLTKELMKESQ